MTTWGIVPVGNGTGGDRTFACARELLPIVTTTDGETPRTVADFLVERMIAGGATKLCFIVPPGRFEVWNRYAGRTGEIDSVCVQQPRPSGFCDALFRAAFVVAPGESLLVGRPDSIWFPADGYNFLPETGLSFLMFSVKAPQRFEPILTDDAGKVLGVEVLQPNPRSSWIWGAAKMDGGTFRALHTLWCERGRIDEHFGTLVNAYLGRGGHAVGVRAGLSYVEVESPHDYREALGVLDGPDFGPRAGFTDKLGGYTDGWRPLVPTEFGHRHPDHRVDAGALHRSNR